MYQHSTIDDINQGDERVMSNTSAKYKWGGVVQKIQEIESRIDLKNKTDDLYDPNFCYPDNDGCSQRSYPNIGGFVSMKKQNLIQLVFKSQCPSINERLYKLEVHIHSIKMKSKTFSPLQTVFISFKKNYLEKESFYIPNEK